MNKLIAIILLVALNSVAADDTLQRVKGGVAAQPGEFRYQVSIQVNGAHVCGGAVISPRHVLTAASCLEPIVKNPQVLIPKTKVLAGTINLKKDGYLLDVSRASVHPDYEYNDLWQSYINDIGIIHLNTAVPRTWWIFTVNLPAATEIPPNAQLLFTGWGSAINTVGLSVDILNKTYLQHISREVCQTYFVDRRIVKSQLCTSANYYIGTCTTDTGRPLVYGNEIVGISTNLHGCGHGKPDIFTKVSYYFNYIHNELEATP